MGARPCAARRGGRSIADRRRVDLARGSSVRRVAVAGRDRRRRVARWRCSIGRCTPCRRGCVTHRRETIRGSACPRVAAAFITRGRVPGRRLLRRRRQRLPKSARVRRGRMRRRPIAGCVARRRMTPVRTRRRRAPLPIPTRGGSRWRPMRRRGTPPVRRPAIWQRPAIRRRPAVRRRPAKWRRPAVRWRAAAATAGIWIRQRVVAAAAIAAAAGGVTSRGGRRRGCAPHVGRPSVREAHRKVGRQPGG